ncbi:MAG: T9SS type A sorting domain-containing protein [Bacteroidales bacterium]|nr:T9SS type A sorting domain-containing protein [Bacteroidales bacterium]
MKKLLSILLFVLAVISLDAQTKSIHPLLVIKAQYHDLSQPLLEMPVILPPSGENEVKEIPNQPRNQMFQMQRSFGESSQSIDPVVQHQQGGESPVKAILNFPGIENTFGYIPPDPTGDVGLNHYLQAVNVTFAVYSKSGYLLYGPASLGTIWQGFPIPHTNDGDPIVRYDEGADRWLVSQFSLPNFPNGPYWELLAISQTSDPLGAWHRYAFQFTNMPDYPKFGVWHDGYYMSANSFSSGALNWMGPAAIVLERDSMLEGKTAQMAFFQLGPGDSPLLPADLDGASLAGKPGIFLSTHEVSGGSGSQLGLYTLETNWENPLNSTLNGPVWLETASYDGNMCNDAENCIPQAGTSSRLDALGGILMERLQYRAFSNHQSMLANLTVDENDQDHAGIRWYELRCLDSTWSVYQQGTYAPDSNHRWIGSISMDVNGNIAMAYSISGKGIYPAIKATGRKAEDPPGLLSLAEATLQEGGGAQTDATSRWGDYSCLTVDPANGRTFWYTNQYYSSTSGDDWKTRIMSFRIEDLPVGLNEEVATNEKGIQLLSNLPNPFNASTVICWRAKSRFETSLYLVDLLGRKTVLLQNQERESGDQQFLIDGTDLPPGVYFCILEAAGQIEMKRIIRY